MPGVRHRQFQISTPALIGDAETPFPGYMDIYPGVESFTIFFQPAGWSQLFPTPMREITNCVSVTGSPIRLLWNRFGES
jgi:hypothetical protein